METVVVGVAAGACVQGDACEKRLTHDITELGQPTEVVAGYPGCGLDLEADDTSVVALEDEVEDALALMQRTGSHLARVITPEGETAGILFLEDVIEQLVGEIRDATQATGIRRLGQPNGG